MRLWGLDVFHDSQIAVDVLGCIVVQSKIMKLAQKLITDFLFGPP